MIRKRRISRVAGYDEAGAEGPDALRRDRERGRGERRLCESNQASDEMGKTWSRLDFIGSVLAPLFSSHSRQLRAPLSHTKFIQRGHAHIHLLSRQNTQRTYRLSSGTRVFTWKSPPLRPCLKHVVGGWRLLPATERCLLNLDLLPSVEKSLTLFPLPNHHDENPPAQVFSEVATLQRLEQ